MYVCSKSLKSPFFLILCLCLNFRRLSWHRTLWAMWGFWSWMHCSAHAHFATWDISCDVIINCSSKQCLLLGYAEWVILWHYFAILLISVSLYLWFMPSVGCWHRKRMNQQLGWGNKSQALREAASGLVSKNWPIQVCLITAGMTDTGSGFHVAPTAFCCWQASMGLQADYEDMIDAFQHFFRNIIM